MTKIIKDNTSSNGTKENLAYIRKIHNHNNNKNNNNNNKESKF